MSVYLATVNVPGYLPEDDDPPVFDSAADAWQYLADERQRDEDSASDDGPLRTSRTRVRMLAIARQLTAGRPTGGWVNADGTGVVYGDTPGGRMYDLGLAYCVTLTEESDG